MKISLFIIFSIFTIPSFSQNSFNTKDLHVKWEIIENFHQGKAQFLSAFTLINKSNTPFPVEGWKIYFNLPRTIESNSVTSGLQIEHLNGDFYTLYPSKDFKGISAGDSVQSSFIAGAWATNKTDAPLGLYIVWQKTNKANTIENYFIQPSATAKQFSRFEGDKVEVASPAWVYDQNKNISDLPEKDLIKVFPSPLNYSESNEVFTITPQTVILSEAVFKNEAAYLSKELQKLSGVAPAIVAKDLQRE